MTVHVTDTVSIIIPVFRVERYLDACIASVLAQTHRALDVILVDDGSPDSCPALCDAWARRDSRVRVIHKQNEGVSAARNAGLDTATGDYLAFVDGDDVVAADLIETLVSLAAQNKAEMAVVAHAAFTTGTPVFTSGARLDIGSGDETLWRIVGERPRWEVWGKLFRRGLFERIRFRSDIRNGEDLEVIARVLAGVRTAVVSDAVLYGYRVREGGAMGASRQGPPADLILAIRSTMDHVDSHWATEPRERQRLVVALLLLAAGKLESIRSWRVWRASAAYRRDYRGLLARRWEDVRGSGSLSGPYRMALGVSRCSPSAFIVMFNAARFVKRVRPSLRRASPPS